jgi:hypothetical protein
MLFGASLDSIGAVSEGAFPNGSAVRLAVSAIPAAPLEPPFPTVADLHPPAARNAAINRTDGQHDARREFIMTYLLCDFADEVRAKVSPRRRRFIVESA